MFQLIVSIMMKDGRKLQKKQLSLKTIFMPNNALRAYLDEKKIFRDLDIDSLFD